MTIIVSSIVLKKDAFVFITRTEVVPKEVNLLVLKVPFVVQEPINTFLGLSRPLFDGIYVFLHPLYGTRVSLVYRPFRERVETSSVFTHSCFTTGHHGDNLSFEKQVFSIIKIFDMQYTYGFGSPSILP